MSTIATLSDFAVSEANRLFQQKKSVRHRSVTWAAAVTAARRAPGLKAAAEALHAIALSDEHTEVKQRIPASLAAFCTTSAVKSADVATVARIAKWLAASNELMKCSTAAAALAATAPIALRATQDPSTEVDAALEAACVAALEATKKNEVIRGRRPIASSAPRHKKLRH